MRIRVDTDDLKAKAKDFQSAADAFGQAGDDILNTALSLPSYEGQLSGPARAAAYEIQRQSRKTQADLAGDAQSLAKTAQDYEAVDNGFISNLKNNQETISANNVPQLDIGFGGDDIVLGYLENGPLIGQLNYIAYQQNGWLITLWENGKSMTFDIRYITSETEQYIKEFMAQVNYVNSPDYYTALTAAVGKYYDLTMKYCAKVLKTVADIIPGASNIVKEIFNQVTGVATDDDKVTIQDVYNAFQETEKLNALKTRSDSWDLLAALEQQGAIPGEVNTSS